MALLDVYVGKKNVFLCRGVLVSFTVFAAIMIGEKGSDTEYENSDFTKYARSCRFKLH